MVETENLIRVVASGLRFRHWRLPSDFYRTNGMATADWIDVASFRDVFAELRLVPTSISS